MVVINVIAPEATGAAAVFGLVLGVSALFQWWVEGRAQWRRLAGRLWPVAVCYWAYEVLSVLSQDPYRVVSAVSHAEALAGFERALGVFWEPWLARHPLPGFSGFYDWAELVVTVLVVGYLAGCEGESFWRCCRDALAFVAVVGLVFFWLFPVAPPRLLPVAYGVPVSTLGSLTGAADQFAAFPSLHTAFAGWVAAVLLAVRPGWLGRLGVFYVCLTAWCVVTTGNHFVVDVVAGELLALGSMWLASRIEVVRLGRLNLAVC